MATNITIPDDLFPRLEKAANDENSTANEVAAEAIKRHLARLAWERLKREAVQRRGNMTEEQVEECVGKAIQEFRAENHER